MDYGLVGKTVIVTGGSSNIGRATALAFIQEGANVVIAARHFEDCQKVADTANTLGGGRAIAVRTDVTKYEDVEAMVKKTLNEFSRVDVLVNNVGMGIWKPFMDLERKLWEYLIEINYTQVLNCFHVVLPLMIKQKSGSIVSLSTVIARRGDPAEPVYAGAKAATIAFSRCIAQQVAREGIRINVVAPALIMPGPAETLGTESAWRVGFSPELFAEVKKQFEAETPMGKIGKPFDVAQAVLFLASDVTAGHITGSVIGVDGGLYMGW